MKIALINWQNHKGSTYKISQMLAQGLKQRFLFNIMRMVQKLLGR